MSTAIGDFVLVCSADPAVTARVSEVSRWPRFGATVPSLSVSTPAPRWTVACSGDVRCIAATDRGGLALTRVPQRGVATGALDAEAEGELRSGLGRADWQPRLQRGRYVYVFWDTAERRIAAFTDLFRSYPVFYAATPEGIVCASDLRLVLAALPAGQGVDATALYHYLNFAYVPAPRSAVQGIRKLEPGSRLTWRENQVCVQRIVDATYPEDLSGGESVRTGELRDLIAQTVLDYRPSSATPWGTFLSGGTDSSSISGILARAAGETPVDSFSIGFSEGAFDELPFARIAARHFGLASHERVVTEADAVAAVERLVQAYDEPFGNSSAIPTFYCAALARDQGKQLLIAGDGGDEIFGGNERYAKDQVFRWFRGSPSPVRGAARLLAHSLSGIDAHWSNRIRNMIRRAGLPNPDRFYSDDSFASDHFDALLSADLRARLQGDESLDHQREIFARAKTDSELHRLMYLDLQMTIAESDVVKVVRAARVAGVDVAFPFLDATLVAYTGRLPERFKVSLLRKRYLFKKAMAGILPREIVKKKKQGFGLPVAVWLRRGGAMRDLVNDVLRSRRALERGYFERVFVEELLRRHERASWDYSSEIFRLLMLELWHGEYLDGA